MRPSFFFARPFRTLLGFHRAPLLSFTKEPPLHRHHHRASTPRDVPAFAFPSPSIGRYHRANPFRPRRFSRPRRLTPHGVSQVYCTLLPVMGSTRFPAHYCLLERPAEASPPPGLPEIPTEVVISLCRATLRVSSPSSEDHVPLPRKLKKKNDILPLGRIHPSKLSPRTPPYQGHHLAPCFHFARYHRLALPLPLLLGASFFHVPPDPFPVPAFPDIQVTSLNHRGLSRARVRCTNTPFPTYPCPLLPWACQAPVLQCPSIMRPYPKSKFDNRTETRPDAPTFDGRGPKSPTSPKASSKALDVPTSSSHPATHYSRSCTNRPGYCVQVCGVP